MTTTREPGQTQASADALDLYMEAGRDVSDARMEVIRLRRQLREATATLKYAQAAEVAAMRAYEATPYSADAVCDSHERTDCPLCFAANA